MIFLKLLIYYTTPCRKKLNINFLLHILNKIIKKQVMIHNIQYTNKKKKQYLMVKLKLLPDETNIALMANTLKKYIFNYIN